MMQVESCNNISTIAMHEYLTNTDDWKLHLMCKHENYKSSHSGTKEVYILAKEFG